MELCGLSGFYLDLDPDYLDVPLLKELHFLCICCMLTLAKYFQREGETETEEMENDRDEIWT